MARRLNQPLSNLSLEQKRQLLTVLLQKKAAQVEHIDGARPLSFGQQGLWLIHQIAPESPAYNIMYAVRIQKALDIPRLQGAIQALVDRHAALRTTYTSKHGEPQRVVHPAQQIWLNVVDASAWTQARFEAEMGREADIPFDLERGPVLRVTCYRRAAEEYVLLLVVHHLALDFWSLDLLLEDFMAFYAGQTPDALCGATYDDYINWQRDMLAGAEGEKLWQFWRDQFSEGAAGVPTLDLPTDRPGHSPPSVQSYQGMAQTMRIDGELLGSLRRLAKTQDVTLFTVILAVFQVLLSRYTRQRELVVGVPMAGRSRPEFERTIGYCVNPVAVRANLTGDPTFQVFLAQTRQSLVAALAHQDFPFPLLVERLKLVRDRGRTPLFQAALVWDKARRSDDPADQENGGQSVGFQVLTAGQRGAPFELMVTFAEGSDSLTGEFRYSADLFNAQTISRMIEHFHVLLRTVTASDMAVLPVSRLPLLTDAESHQLLITWNASRNRYPIAMCLHQLFEAQASRTPDAVAVIFDAQHITYTELNQTANQLAHYLHKHGISPGARVGICLERSPRLLVALLAVLKAGSAYVPLDAAYPQERLTFMVQDSGAQLVLTQTGLTAWEPIVETLDLGFEWGAILSEPTGNPQSLSSAEDFAYIIYTSGSTSLPKGMAIAHRNATAFTTWATQAFAPQELANVLASTSICFDLSIFELFAPLCCGGGVILAENALHFPFLLAAHKITLVNTVPSVMAELLRFYPLPSSVRTVNLAGEALPNALVQSLYEAGVRRVLNLYGPTETTTYSTFAEIKEGYEGIPPIGRPIANTQVYVLDEQLQPVPIGVPGELYIGGAGVGLGYLNRPELTAESFVPNPFVANRETGVIADETQNFRLYRTGDLVRYLPDGNLEYLGRLDYQVKIRGFRIEPDEIEAALSGYPGIAETVVIAREDSSGQKRLVAYLACDADLAPSVGALQRHLATLPHYMIPSAFVVVPKLPRMPNGKVDRRALPALGTDRPDLMESYVAASTATEVLLCSLFSQVLGIERVGINDNFFELGGASLQAVRLTLLATEAGLPLSPEVVFQYQTVAELADLCSSASSAPNTGNSAGQRAAIQ